MGWISIFFEPFSMPSAMFSKSKSTAMRRSGWANPEASALATGPLRDLGLSKGSEPELELGARPLLLQDDLRVGLDPPAALDVEQRLDDRLGGDGGAELAESLGHLSERDLRPLRSLLPRGLEQHLHEREFEVGHGLPCERGHYHSTASPRNVARASRSDDHRGGDRTRGYEGRARGPRGPATAPAAAGGRPRPGPRARPGARSPGRGLRRRGHVDGPAPARLRPRARA